MIALPTDIPETRNGIRPYTKPLSALVAMGFSCLSAILQQCRHQGFENARNVLLPTINQLRANRPGVRLAR